MPLQYRAAVLHGPQTPLSIETVAMGQPQICAAVDLFEVIAELAGLNLEVTAQSAEAVRLALEAQRELEDSQDRLEDASGSD